MWDGSHFGLGLLGACPVAGSTKYSNSKTCEAAMKGQAAKSAHLLLLVDESSASKRMVAYVAGIIGRRRNFHIHLLYLMPFMPVQLLETGGADTPKKETELNAELHRQQDQWIVSKETAAKPALDELV